MRQIVVFFMLLVASATVKGQVLKSIGFKERLTIANQTWHYKIADYNWKKDNLIGNYNVASLEFFNTKYVSLVTDIGYIGKGSSQKTITSMPSGDETEKTHKNRFN